VKGNVVAQHQREKDRAGESNYVNSWLKKDKKRKVKNNAKRRENGNSQHFNGQKIKKRAEGMDLREVSRSQTQEVRGLADKNGKRKTGKVPEMAIMPVQDKCLRKDDYYWRGTNKKVGRQRAFPGRSKNKAANTYGRKGKEISNFA